MASLRSALGAVFLVWLGGCSAEPEPPALPEDAEFVAVDVARFWTAYDEGTASGDLAGAFERGYRAGGSSHLGAFFERRIESSAKLAETVLRNHLYYESTRAQMLALAAGGEWWSDAQAAFAELERIEPGSVFPPVALVVGRFQSGGTTSNSGLSVALEIFTREPNAPTQSLTAAELASVRSAQHLLPFVIHQLSHVQQVRLGHLRSVEGRTLLERALFEGIAEFVSERLTGAVVGTAAAAYGQAHEAELWADFQTAMHGTEVTGWLEGASSDPERPGDVGYFVGYRIASSYAESQGDWEAGLRGLLRAADPNVVLSESGYAPQ